MNAQPKARCTSHHADQPDDAQPGDAPPEELEDRPVEVLHAGEDPRRRVPPAVGQDVEALVGDVEAAAGHQQRGDHPQRAWRAGPPQPPRRQGARLPGRRGGPPGIPTSWREASRGRTPRRGTHRPAPIRNAGPLQFGPNRPFRSLSSYGQEEASRVQGPAHRRRGAGAQRGAPRGHRGRDRTGARRPRHRRRRRQHRRHLRGRRARSATRALEVHRLPENQGVGGAIVHGHKRALELGCDVSRGDGRRRADGPGVPPAAARPDRRRRGGRSPRPTGSTARAPSRACRGTASSATSGCRS